MSSRRNTNLQLREAVIQRFINEIERKYSETSNDNLIEKRKLQDMKLFVKLIDPDSDILLKTTSLEKIIRRISRLTAVLFTSNDIAMLNTLLTYTFLTRPRILDDQRFRRRSTRLREFFSISSSLPEDDTPTQRTRRRSPSIRGNISNEQITPGAWVRGTSFPTYTTQSPLAPTVSSIPYTPLAPTASSIPQTPSAQDVSSIPSQNVPWGYEDTSIEANAPQQNILFEEDQTPDKKIRTNKSSLIVSSDNNDLVKCDDENNDTDANIKLLSDNNKQWVENNCYSCLNLITQYNYTQEEWNDLVSIKQLDSNGKFKRGHCISINSFKEIIKRDLITSIEKFNKMDYRNIFSIYKLKNKNLSESDLRRGLGTHPTKYLTFLLDFPSGRLFIDIESAYKLIHSKSKEMYALPLFGGLRRRVGNLKGSLMEMSTLHGQIDGYKIYRLLTKSEIENEINVNFELQVLIELQSLLQHAYKEDETNTNLIANITNNIIKILTEEKN